MKLGQKISELRKKNHLSQEALAQKMNVSRQAVSKWESNQSIPDIEKIVDLSELFGVTTDYLLKNGTPSFEVTNTSKDEQEDESLPVLKDEQIEQYLKVAKKANHYESLAPALFFLAFAVFQAFLTLQVIFSNVDRIFQTIGFVLAIITIAYGVGSFVNAKLIMREFKDINQNQFTLTNKQKDNLTFIKQDFRKNNNKRIISAVVLTILAFIPPIVISEMHTGDNLSVPLVAVIFILLSLASYELTYYAVQASALSRISLSKKILSKQDRDLLTFNSVISWVIIFSSYILFSHYISYSLANLLFCFSLVAYVVATLIFFKKKAH
ncbi:helix-turn-helix domain-containing protein [Lactobacillus kalixensis]|uniref:Transcriptional regulator n=1 Tax=Lactobacillus kalixensis DSM 16043 TaxID=1423763 RepID=A0A0R1UGQ6_9LACO|nr:helix-turn-helix transcriptional regulator [Lactobacillus kalixensis]KRL90248.1 transcriptional regulator [Lactobacillus kalixensis DSM 16043]